MRYDNFSTEYVAFEEEEEIDENAIEQLELKDSSLEITSKEKDLLLEDVKQLIGTHKLSYEVDLTIHGKSRLLERIGAMSDKEMLDLVNVAYEFGKNPVHFYESDPLMFKYLRYQQAKQKNKVIKMYKNILFFFSMTPPHVLVTCFHYKSNYDNYVAHER